jgi:hypothetical protein
MDAPLLIPVRAIYAAHCSGNYCDMTVSLRRLDEVRAHDRLVAALDSPHLHHVLPSCLWESPEEPSWDGLSAKDVVLHLVSFMFVSF